MMLISAFVRQSSRFYKQAQIRQALQSDANRADMILQSLLSRANFRTLVICSCGASACSASCSPAVGTPPNSRVEFKTRDTQKNVVIYQAGDALYLENQVLIAHHVIGFVVTGDGQDLSRIYYTLDLAATDYDGKTVDYILPNHAVRIYDGWSQIAAIPPPSPPSPPPVCIPNGTCSGTIPACSTSGPGTDNCGNPCTLLGPVCSPPPPPPCVPNGTCTGAIPPCGTTGPGVDNCGNGCTLTGPVCPPPPPPPCVPSGVCSGAPPACGTTGPGVDNCGNPCTLTGPACPPPFCGDHGSICADEGGQIAGCNPPPPDFAGGCGICCSGIGVSYCTANPSDSSCTGTLCDKSTVRYKICQ